MENMSDNTKLEVALEILAAKIADESKKGKSASDDEMKLLIKEREEMYSGNKEILEKIINVYGPEIKNNYERIVK